MIAAITGASLLTVLVWLVIAAVVYYVVSWGLSKAALPEPFGKVANIILILVVVILIVNALLMLVGRPLF